MPKETFLHLSKEKKEGLLKSARKEFSRVPFDEASINRIVKDAQIARGSFYMYFDSKEDLYFYLLEDGKKRMEEVFLNVLKENKGDLIETFLSLYENILKRKIVENNAFFRNIISNTSFKNKRFLKPNFFSEEILEKILKEVDKSLISFEKDSFQDVFRILQMETIYSLMMYYKEHLSLEEAIFTYQQRMNLLKYGIYRK